MPSPHTYSFAMDGDEVVQTRVTKGRDGEDETHISRLGNRDVVLRQVTKQTVEAKEKLDGVMAAGTESPLPATGPEGQSKRYHVKDGMIFCTDINRRNDGKVQSASTRCEGHKAEVLKNSQERYDELETVRKGIAEAK